MAIALRIGMGLAGALLLVIGLSIKGAIAGRIVTLALGVGYLLLAGLFNRLRSNKPGVLFGVVLSLGLVVLVNAGLAAVYANGRGGMGEAAIAFGVPLVVQLFFILGTRTLIARPRFDPYADD